jgi:predicted deacylase
MTFLSLLVFLSCSSPQGTGPPSSDPPSGFDTTDKPVHYQTRRTYSFDNGTVFFSNEFPGGRLNSVSQTAPQNYQIGIEPENIPINNSAWYSFYILADDEQSIQVTLTYQDGNHRYVPKLSTDGQGWQPIDSQDYSVNTVENTAALSLQIGPDTLWVSAQELLATSHMQEWMEGLSHLGFVDLNSIGASVNGRELVAMRITENPEAGRHILIIGRQHPPEITGSIALKAFLERLSEDDSLSRRFRQNYVVSAVPLVNPDGVDEGHWRHNAHGVDLNRDWVNFNQIETTTVRDHFLRETQQAGEPVFFAVDFHSTQVDLFYTLSPNLTTTPPGLTEQWLDAIAQQFSGENLNIQPSGIGTPTSKAFFYSTFHCPSVIYEVGDETDREYIRAKARFAATALMELLLEL